MKGFSSQKKQFASLGSIARDPNSVFALPTEDTHFAGMGSEIESYQGKIYEEALRVTPHRRLAIDVGAHVGIFSRRMAHDFDRTVSFEPDARNYECLVDNMMPFNVVPIWGAAGRARGRGEIKVNSKTNTGARSFIYGMGGSVPVFMLDQFHFGLVDLIKIDTEGCESEVIFGALDLLKRCHPTLILERPDAELQIRLMDLNYRQVVTINKDTVFAEKQ